MQNEGPAAVIARIVEAIAATPGCTIFPPASDAFDARWPEDVIAFHRQCGGALLFPDSDYPAEVLPAGQVLPANMVILGEEIDDDPSAEWVTVVRLRNGDYLTMDLRASKAGYIYDSGHEVHGLVGEMPVAATSFTDLLFRLLGARGGYWFWLAEDFESLGDAYDP